MKYHELYYRDEQYFVSGDSLHEARQKFALEHVCRLDEVQSAFRHNFPVIFLKLGIGVCILAAVYFLAYLIF